VVLWLVALLQTRGGPERCDWGRIHASRRTKLRHRGDNLMQYTKAKAKANKKKNQIHLARGWQRLVSGMSQWLVSEYEWVSAKKNS